jgi:PEP-CTERM motif-containing protein
MKKLQWFVLLTVLALGANAAFADGVSFVGTLTSPDDFFSTTITLTTNEQVTLQTYGFGGGTNQAGALIAPGGTDPFVGLFSGTGAGATFINGTSLDLTNYPSFVGCPPANSVSNFGGTTCGDVTMSFSSLAPGTYTVLLSDGQFIPLAAVGGGSTLGDGFLDLTGGQFCNIADFADGETDCPNLSGAFALDIITNSSGPAVAEPSSLLLLGTGLLGVIGIRRRAVLSKLFGEAR